MCVLCVRLLGVTGAASPTALHNLCGYLRMNGCEDYRLSQALTSLR